MSEEDLFHCPYNYSHIILRSRMATHLQKCRGQFPLDNYTTCPFNATHDVPVPELKYHTDTCPDRKTMENYLYVIDDEKEEEISNPDPVQVQASVLNENWDEEKVSPSYLDLKSHLNADNKLIRPPCGCSKAIKRAFCQNQEKKFLRADEKAKSGPSQLAKSDH